MKRSTTTLVLALLCLCASTNARSQETRVQPDSAQIAALMANSLKASKPAEYVLGFTTELRLTPEQITFLETLASAQRDSQPVRQARMMEAIRIRSRETSTSSIAQTMMWTGPVDEKALREQACAQSAATVETTIALVNDRHAVGAVLTREQLALLPRLEMQAMMNAMKRP